MISLLILTSLAWSLGPPSVSHNNKGVESFEKGDFESSFKDFSSALSRDATNPAYHFNLGNAFDKQGDGAKGLAEMESVDGDPKASKELKFQAMFNAGNMAVQAKDFDKALSYYQRALGYFPQSAEAKWNIELALKEQQKSGGGGGSDKDQKDKDKKDDKKEDGKDGDQQQQQQQRQESSKTKPTPRPYQGKDLNEQEVKAILEELKRQEESIRAKQFENKKPNKDSGHEKDW